MRDVIVNFTPLTILCNIGKLCILRDIYGEIMIPEAVYREVAEKEDSACIQIMSANEWIHVAKEKDSSEKKIS